LYIRRIDSVFIIFAVKVSLFGKFSLVILKIGGIAADFFYDNNCIYPRQLNQSSWNELSLLIYIC